LAADAPLNAESRVGAKASQGLKQCRGTNVEDHMEITHWPRGAYMKKERNKAYDAFPRPRVKESLCDSISFLGMIIFDL
jgi:hypothetical protein